MVKYSEEQIRAARILLESIETHGIENAKRIVMISNILEKGEKTDDCSKES